MLLIGPGIRVASVKKKKKKGIRVARAVQELGLLD
jgi:hypothetical protein